jgi:hypothetical protein
MPPRGAARHARIVIAAEREDVVHPTITEQIARNIQQDRLARAAQMRLARAAAHERLGCRVRIAAPAKA